MSSGCLNSVSCVDARAPVRATYVNLYKWPESDAEFVRSVTSRGKGNRGSEHNFSRSASGRRRWSQGPWVVDSYSCRQMYLRSYTFSKKETVPEKTVKCFGKVKERAVLFSKESTGSVSSYGSTRSNPRRRHQGKNNEKKKKKKKKRCIAAVKKVKDASCLALYSLFRGLLSCTTSVDIVDVVDSKPSQ